jgi:hypothetical protein
LALPPKDDKDNKDNEAFYREVDEELRRAQLGGFFKRYGLYVGIAAVLFLLVLGGVLWWQNDRRVLAEKDGETLVAEFDDIESGKIKGTDPRIEALAAGSNDGYRGAALLTRASLAIRAGNEPGAVEIYRKVAADDALEEPYRNLALIRQTALEYDKLKPDAVIDRLKPLAVSGNPWFGSAGEMVAVAYLNQGKPQLAAPIFAAMAKDDKVPESIRARATQMAGSLGVDVVQDAGATKEVTR